MLAAIEIILFSLLGFFLSYLLLLALLALFVPIRKQLRTKQIREFAFVVPAHNEEITIEKTIRSLLDVDYPREQFDVIVIADNCSDETAAIARKSGAIVLERFNKIHRGKGFALQWAFGNIMESPASYTAVVVIDADSTVSKNFLRVMNWYVEQGFGAIQSADLVASNPQSWSSEVSRVSLALYNYAKPLGRKAMKCVSGLRGNGMCFTVDTLRKVPWQAHSITEDTEYGIALLLNGIDTVLAPEATVLATMPAKPKNAESQRTRWEGGRISLIKKYTPLILRAILKDFSWKKVDMLIELLTPAFVNMVGFILLVMGIKYGMFVAGVSDALEFIMLWWVLCAFSILYISAGLCAVKADLTLVKAIIYFPRYLLWKMQLYSKFIISGISKEWVRTTRER